MSFLQIIDVSGGVHIINCVRREKILNVWCDVSFLKVQIIDYVRRGKTSNVWCVSFLKVQIIDVSGGGRH